MNDLINLFRSQNSNNLGEQENPLNEYARSRFIPNRLEAIGQGLAIAGATALANGGPSLIPKGMAPLGQGMAAGFNAYQQSLYNQALQDQRERKLEADAQSQSLDNQLKQKQLDNYGVKQPSIKTINTADGIMRYNNSTGKNMGYVTNPDGSRVMPQKSGTTVNVGGKKYTKIDEDYMKSLDKKTLDARNNEALIDRAVQILDSGFETNTFAPAKSLMEKGANFATAGGYKPKNLIQAEEFNSISKKIAMTAMQLLGGSDTERELKISIDTGISQGKLEESNRAILKLAKEVAMLPIIENEFFNDWLANYGSKVGTRDQQGRLYIQAFEDYKQDYLQKINDEYKQDNINQTGVSPQFNQSLQIPMRANGKVNFSQLIKGKTYMLKDGTEIIWNGQNATPVTQNR